MAELTFLSALEKLKKFKEDCEFKGSMKLSINFSSNSEAGYIEVHDNLGKIGDLLYFKVPTG